MINDSIKILLFFQVLNTSYEVFITVFKVKKQSSKGVLRKRSSENMQKIYRRTPMPKCDFNTSYFNTTGLSDVKMLLFVFKTASEKWLKIVTINSTDNGKNKEISMTKSIS